MTRTEQIARAIFTENVKNHPKTDLLDSILFDGLLDNQKQTMMEMAEIVELCMTSFPDANLDDLILTTAAAMCEGYFPQGLWETTPDDIRNNCILWATVGIKTYHNYKESESNRETSSIIEVVRG